MAEEWHFTVASAEEPLGDLILCLEREKGMNVRVGRRGFAAGEIVYIDGDREGIIERLAECDPDWAKYLVPRWKP